MSLQYYAQWDDLDEFDVNYSPTDDLDLLPDTTEKVEDDYFNPELEYL